MALLAAYVLDFVTNIIPFFMPPSWILLSFFKVKYDVPIWLLTPGGALCSTGGRVVLALICRHAGSRWLPEKERKNVADLGKFIARKRLSFWGYLFYAFGPIPSSHLFIAAGLARLNLRAVAAGFCLGRLVSYTVLVLTANSVADNLVPLFKKQFGSWFAWGSVAFAVLFVIALLKIDWRKALRRWWPEEDDAQDGPERPSRWDARPINR